MPEAEDIDLEIPASDIRLDTYRSSGAGGQHVNTSAFLKHSWQFHGFDVVIFQS